MRTTLEPENNLKSIKTTKPKTYFNSFLSVFFSVLFLSGPGSRKWSDCCVMTGKRFFRRLSIPKLIPLQWMVASEAGRRRDEVREPGGDLAVIPIDAALIALSSGEYHTVGLCLFIALTESVEQVFQ